MFLRLSYTFTSCHVEILFVISTNNTLICYNILYPASILFYFGRPIKKKADRLSVLRRSNLRFPPYLETDTVCRCTVAKLNAILYITRMGGKIVKQVKQRKSNVKTDRSLSEIAELTAALCLQERDTELFFSFDPQPIIFL